MEARFPPLADTCVRDPSSNPNFWRISMTEAAKLPESFIAAVFPPAAISFFFFSACGLISKNCHNLSSRVAREARLAGRRFLISYLHIYTGDTRGEKKPTTLKEKRGALE